MYAHRISIQLSGREIPPGSVACHHCDNPPCVNPLHLFVGTMKDNQQDASRKGRSYPVGRYYKRKGNGAIRRDTKDFGPTDYQCKRRSR